MRRIARTDANQAAIVAALRGAGCSVQPLHQLGGGVPDLLVGRAVNGRGTNYLLEVKDGAKKPSARRLTPDEHQWIAEWRGTASIVESVDEALRAVGLLP